ncbi:restriction endonuclease subunit S [Lactobacillus salivarius]|uniref:restriction endonuclease subunit S n=2 Tax=Ligilactobacillus salivarius TaxID=1624 RepID=UPI0013694FB1|nr:restriction endonuclease subunit S [Ligilactobacillus salivarius]MYZ67468.1 restriction endonuclease subunit S [Ligilactobacillus salivarius]
MAKEEKKAPKLRFNGYTNDWERKELNNILKINSGRDYKQLNSGNIPVYGTGGYMLSVNDKLSDTDAVGIGRKGTIDKPLYLKAPFWTVDTLFYCTSKENSDVKFIYLLFQIINWKRYDESTGVPSLSKNTISSIKTYVPKVKEQDHISKLFFSLDNTLQLHERKCEELTLIKKALLQKFFPKKDEVTPEVRYKSFSDDWEQRKFGDLYKKVSEKNDGTYGADKIISVANMYYKSDVKISGKNYLKTYNIFKVGDIAFEGNKSKHFAHGRFVENTIGDGIVSHVFDVFRPTMSKYDLQYWSYLINNENVMGKILIKSTNASTMMTNLVSKDFLKQNIIVPNSYEEEKKIGKFLNEFDSLIALHQRKLEKLKQLKKFLLQNMFI